MEQAKKALNDFMTNLKKENPNANWSNLATGIVILLVLAVFSFWYFGEGQGVVTEEALDAQTEQAVNTETTQPETTPTTEDTTMTAPTETQQMDQPAAVKQVDPNAQQVTVLAGEGLWHVAVRVCNDGEKYNMIADQNGLSVWEDLNEGMTLTVSCGK